MNISLIKVGDTTYDISDSAVRSALESGELIHYVLNITGTAAVTSKPYNAAIWAGTCPGVASLYTGLTVLVKVPVAGNGTYGTVLNINEWGNHPVVANVNTMVSTRYTVGCIITLIYDAEQAANVYTNSNSASSITGCWKIADYDSTNIYLLRHNYGTYVAYAAVKSAVLFLQKNETSLLPVNSVGGTATNKTLTTESFNPFGCILYYSSTTEVAAGASIGATYLYQQIFMDLRYSFNTGTSLTANKDIYIVADLQSDGMAKLASSPIAQELPSIEDGKLYIYLGHAYDTYRIELHPVHPIYWRKNGKIQLYTGIDPDDKLDKLSGDGTNVVLDDGTTNALKNFAIRNTYQCEDTTGGVLGYYKITINSTKWWNIAFTIRLYSMYKYYDIIIMGNNSRTDGPWTTKKAILSSSTDTNIIITFGHNQDGTSFVAVPAYRYTGINICDATVVDSPTNITQKINEISSTSLFSIELKPTNGDAATTLGGVIDENIRANAPLTRVSNLVLALNNMLSANNLSGSFASSNTGTDSWDITFSAS